VVLGLVVGEEVSELMGLEVGDNDVVGLGVFNGKQATVVSNNTDDIH
jgi:hypothetical protein